MTNARGLRLEPKSRSFFFKFASLASTMAVGFRLLAWIVEASCVHRMIVSLVRESGLRLTRGGLGRFERVCVGWLLDVCGSPSHTIWPEARVQCEDDLRGLLWCRRAGPEEATRSVGWLV